MVKNSCPSAYGVCMLVVVPGAAIAQSTFCFDPRPALMMTMQKLKPSRVPPLRNNTMLTTGIDKSTSLSTFIFTTQQTPFFFIHIFTLNYTFKTKEWDTTKKKQSCNLWVGCTGLTWLIEPFTRTNERTKRLISNSDKLLVRRPQMVYETEVKFQSPQTFQLTSSIGANKENVNCLVLK